MKSRLKITFLGTGSALGVPQIGCSCPVCISKANVRQRTCFLLEKGTKTFILDPGPDTRIQLLNHPIKSLEGIIITHAHYDHIGGYDDLRAFGIKQEKAIPTLIHEKNIEELKRRCGYLFKTGQNVFSLDLVKETKGSGEFEGLKYRYMTYIQNGMNVTGYIIDNVAFISDIQRFDERLVKELQGVATLIVSCVTKSYGNTKSHLNLDEIQDLKISSGAKKVIITHMGHDIDSTTLSSQLKGDISLSYDGFTYEA
jgi:phosphoribosyl 1,2-cyclic phosphate phosphodiesterase